MTLIVPIPAVDAILSEKETEGHSTPWYRVEDFGFLTLSINEKHSAYTYPTPDYPHEPGWFNLEFRPALNIDINGDGKSDLVMTPQVFPHTVPRNTDVQPIVMIQGNDGKLSAASVTKYAPSIPAKYMLHNLASGDFNGDGVQDLASESTGIPNFEKYIDTEAPIVIFGSTSGAFAWTDSYDDIKPSDFMGSHSLAVGDFNGDGLDDWVSGRYALYGRRDSSFFAQRLEPVGDNAIAAGDFNNDGFDDIISSSMPGTPDPNINGGDLVLMLGSAQGLLDDENVIFIDRNIPSFRTENVGTNDIVAADFSGDGQLDIVLLEHDWSTDAGDFSEYYRNASLRFFLGDGKGNFTESTHSIQDPFAGERQGEADFRAMDINGDGWLDLIVLGAARHSPALPGYTFGDLIGTKTSIFLNQGGRLELIDSNPVAYVQRFQLSGYEHLKEWQASEAPLMHPIDLGNDGMIDFVGFVDTPLSSWPQEEVVLSHAFVSRALKPLGRNTSDETLIGTLGNDKIFGYDGNDIIHLLKGNDFVHGGSGIDTAVFLGTSAEYLISLGSTSSIVVDNINDRDGTDTLTNIERLQFTDTNVALDLGGTAGQAYRIYEAVLGRAPDLKGLGYWINDMDNGISLTTIAQGFIASKEFQDKYGVNPSYETYVNLLYQNILGREPDTAGLNYWVSNMQKGIDTPAVVLASFSEGIENTANVALDIANGIYYTPWIT